MTADFGTEPHYAAVFEETHRRLTEAILSKEPKHGRWWAVDEEAVAQRPLRNSLFMLLIFVGPRRKWW